MAVRGIQHLNIQHSTSSHDNSYLEGSICLMPRSMAVMKPDSAGARWPDGLVACRDSRWPSVPRNLSNASQSQPSFVVTLIQIRLSVVQLAGSPCSKPHRVFRVARLHLRFGRSSLASMIDKSVRSTILSCGAMGPLWVTWHREPGINTYVKVCTKLSPGLRPCRASTSVLTCQPV